MASARLPFRSFVVEIFRLRMIDFVYPLYLVWNLLSLTYPVDWKNPNLFIYPDLADVVMLLAAMVCYYIKEIRIERIAVFMLGLNGLAQQLTRAIRSFEEYTPLHVSVIVGGLLFFVVFFNRAARLTVELGIQEAIHQQKDAERDR